MSMAALVVDNSATCLELRRQLGATSWFVLEELVVHAVAESGGMLRAQVSTRELSAKLALNKDTVTRALAKLRSCGVITVVARGGATGASVFAIRVTAGLVIDDRGVVADVVARRGKRRRTGAPHEAVAQLSLLT
jgi:hypothetical protein